MSPTLFLVFVHDIVGDMPRKVQGAIFADDLVLWCSEEHLSTAKHRMQQALNTLEGWTNRWLVKINPRKTTYTIFSLSLPFDARVSAGVHGASFLDTSVRSVILSVSPCRGEGCVGLAVDTGVKRMPLSSASS